MVHFWNRSSGTRISPAMLQPREWSGRSGTSATHASSNAVGVVGSSSRGGSKSGGGGGGSSAGSGGLCLLSRLGQYKRRQHEQYKRRVAEKELETLHQRIDKLLAKLEERAPDTPLDVDEECVVCLGARATMQTFPCEHRVVCRKCFIRTIQVAVAQRLLPLRCVVCRTRIVKLRHSAAGSKAVTVSTGSPFHSASAPPIGHQLSHGGSQAFIVNNNNSTVVTTSKILAVASLGKVSPCRPAVSAGQKNGKPSPSALYVPDPPRVTLTNGTSGQFSSVSKPSHVIQRDASSSVATTKETTPSAVKASPGTKSAAPDKTGEVISDSHLVRKGNNSQASRRGIIFSFKPLFWR